MLIYCHDQKLAHSPNRENRTSASISRISTSRMGLNAQEDLPENSVCERGRVGSDCTCVFIKYREFW